MLLQDYVNSKPQVAINMQQSINPLASFTIKSTLSSKSLATLKFQGNCFLCIHKFSSFQAAPTIFTLNQLASFRCNQQRS
ncbi:expressed unknown protein [Seminavis robusta]|uniref:Uncharacterized protein n=1 Tax=Seminavis robusta TaxID=568900 RepID=A0A9N8EY94_9STRA|nr:expressed unknown protein [Seminavis robusta]|eukprot:Sro2064_g313170.1 n/a (80) ;mRNA; f:11289-11613